MRDTILLWQLIFEQILNQGWGKHLYNGVGNSGNEVFGMDIVW